ncbi:MAG: hypothetical protein O7C61_06410 [SAR324 cluster bacterium]|nr:hypothetical protein [SAR324 cluster bacterium]
MALLLPLLAVPVQAQLIKKEGPLITVRATGRAELGEGADQWEADYALPLVCALAVR